MHSLDGGDRSLLTICQTFRRFGEQVQAVYLATAWTIGRRIGRSGSESGGELDGLPAFWTIGRRIGRSGSQSGGELDGRAANQAANWTVGRRIGRSAGELDGRAANQASPH
jgi:hypothetical protein